MPNVSLVATLVGTALGFVLGALWYGPLFGKTWMAAVGLTPETIRLNINPARTYGTTFVLSPRGVLRARAVSWAPIPDWPSRW